MSSYEAIYATEIANASLVGTGPFFNKHAPVRAVVGVVCGLSMIGALLIIFSYICIKDIRTKAREILVNLSVADFGAACSNFIGVNVYFDQYIRNCMTVKDVNGTVGPSKSPLSCHTLKDLCTAQAFFAGYFTLVSVLWTLCLSVYIYCLVVHNYRKFHIKVVYFSYVFCWVVPLLVVLWLVFTGRLGYSPHGGSGWCSLRIEDKQHSTYNIFVVIFGNDLWIYSTFFMVTVLYFTTHCYIKFQAQDSNPLLLSGTHATSLQKADTKFLVIPFAFLLLRIWSIIMVIVFVYAQREPHSPWSSILIYATGIGDSGQGFVNALLFCVFTPTVRRKILFCCREKSVCPPLCCWKKKKYLSLQQPSSASMASYHRRLSGSKKVSLT